MEKKKKKLTTPVTPTLAPRMLALIRQGAKLTPLIESVVPVIARWIAAAALAYLAGSCTDAAALFFDSSTSNAESFELSSSTKASSTARVRASALLSSSLALSASPRSLSFCAAARSSVAGRDLTVEEGASEGAAAAAADALR